MRVAGLLLVVAVSPLLALRTDIIFSRTTPGVWEVSRPTPVLLEVMVDRSVDRVALEMGTGVYGAPRRTVALNDDGSQGDRVGHDSVFSVLLDTDTLTSYYRLDPGAGLNLGTLHLYAGSTEVVAATVGVRVLRSGIASPTATAVDDRLAYSARVANLKVSEVEFFDLAQRTDWIARQFYRYFKDDFDFLTVLWEANTYQNPTHSLLRSAVDGIGIGRYGSNVGEDYGSPSRLIGLNTNALDTQNTGFVILHELGHQWINGLTHPVLKDPFGGGHWPLSDLATGIMGFSSPSDGEGLGIAGDLAPEGNGYRVVHQDTRRFTDLDLYLMGFRSAENVKPHFVFQNQQQMSAVGEGGFLAGPVTFVGIDEIVAFEGPRKPGVDTSPKRFTMGVIVVSQDRFLTPSEMAWYEYSASLVDQIFNRATDGLGHMETTLSGSLLPASQRPAIKAVVSSASLGNTAGVAPLGWATVYGTAMTQDTRSWTWSDFTGGSLPTRIAATSVTVGGRQAPVSYASPSQINFLVPEGVAQGSWPVEVVSPKGTLTSTVEVKPLVPLLFSLTSGLDAVAAVHVDGSYVCRPEQLPGAACRPAKSGEVIAIYGSGFGETSPERPALQMLSQPLPLKGSVEFQSDLGTLDVRYAGLVGPGLYQFNIVMPTVHAAARVQLWPIVNGSIFDGQKLSVVVDP